MSRRVVDMSLDYIQRMFDARSETEDSLFSQSISQTLALAS
jgi:hypothetical protein